MAFINPKYELIFDDNYQLNTGTRNVYRIHVYKDAYSGAALPITGTESPFMIESIDTEGDSYIPVMATRATLNIISNPAQATNFNTIITEFFSANDDEFMLVAQKGTYNGSSYTWGDVIWRGFYLPVDSIQYSPHMPLALSLTFVDGLAKIKNKKYYFNLTNGIGFFPDEKISIKNILTECFFKTDLGLNVWINEYYKNTTISSRNIENMYLKKNYLATQYGEYLSYYDILEFMCNRFGWECYYKNDRWYVTSYAAQTIEPNIIYYVYNSAGTYQSTQTITTPAAITIDGTDNFRQIGKSLIVSLNRAQKSYTQFSPIYNVKQLIANAWFLSWSSTNNVDAWLETGMVATKLNATTGGLTTTDVTTSATETNRAIRSFGNPVKAGDYLTITWLDYTFNCTSRYWIRIIPSDNSSAQYLDTAGSFTTNTIFLGSYPAGFPKQILVPIDGTIDFIIYRPLSTGASPFMELYYFICQNLGPVSQIYQYDSYREVASKNSQFKSEEDDNKALGFMYDDIFRNSDSAARSANSPKDVASSSYVGMYTDVNNAGFFNTFGRNTAGSNQLFTLVAQDIGIDQIQTQTVIEGEFKSAGYWLNTKFNYNYDGTNVYNYLLKSFKWDLKKAIQSSVLKKINFVNTFLAIDVFRNLNTKE
jgi:hypothetical protein